MRTLSRRARAAVLMAALALVLVPATITTAQSSDDDLRQAMCALPAADLERTLLGWSPDRGPELTWQTKEPDFVGSGLPHVGPWDYIQHVPMFWYGPGFVQARGEVSRPVTLADIAPTQAALLDFDGFTAPDGTVMREALDPGVGQEGYTPPKVIVVLVWDAGGINVLEEHRGLWPFTESLIDDGTWYENAFVGSSPTSTAQAHATIGTGAFPIHHGMVGHHFKVGGHEATPWELGPNYLMLPTLADLYDQAMDNEPVVGLVATADIHFGMLSHGSFWKGGDRDVAVTRSAAVKETLTSEGDTWNMPTEIAPFYELAGYLNGVKGFDKDKEQLDRADGKLDGNWRDNSIVELLNGFDTPARTTYQERVAETMLKRERFGQDDVPDLFYANFKQIDFVSHVWSMNSPEMADSVAAQDQAMESLVTYLDREVGEGEWAMVMTADHAAMPDPAVTGGYQVSTGPIGVAIQETFDGDDDDVPVVTKVQPTQAFLNVDELAEHGYTTADVARFVQQMTKADTAGGGVTPPAGTEGQPAFEAVFPSDLLLDLPCLTPPDDVTLGP